MSPKDAERQARLAQALRDNLKRRKAKARAVAEREAAFVNDPRPIRDD